MSWSTPDRGGPAAGIVMQFGRGTRVAVLLLLTAAAMGFLILSLRTGAADARIPRVLLGALTLALIPAALDVFGIAHRLRPDGIERVSPWSRRAVIRWADVTSIEWIERTRWFELRARSGERVRVPERLGGMAAFARVVLDGVPADVVDARAGLRARLEQLARGERPPDEPEPEAWRGG